MTRDPAGDLAGVHRLAARQHGAVTAAQLAAAGLTPPRISRLVRAGQWRRVLRGVYLVPAATTDEVRALAAAALFAAPAGSVCGHTLAAHLWGMHGAGPHLPLHVTAPPTAARLRRPELVVHRTVLLAADRSVRHGFPVTSPPRTLCDLATSAPAATAVCAADSALANRLCTPAQLADYAGRWPRRVRNLLALADGRSESPLETRVRLRLVGGGLPPPVPQYVVLDRGGEPYARLDLAYPAFRVGIEADGTEVHGAVEALYADRRRQNRLVADGWLIVRFTWEDVMRRPWVIVTEVGRALRAHGWAPAA